jgi:nickel-dependent lactate racemase
MNAPVYRALTPEDSVCIVVDEQLPHLPELIAELVRHLQRGGIDPSAITLLVAPPSGSQPWADELPDDLGDVKIEVHHPEDSKKLAYLATTEAGRRVYLNRTLVDAAFVAVLAGRRYDRRFGYCGAEVAIFPTLSDQPTREALLESALTKDGPKPAERRAEAAEVAWLMGLPILIQAIEGPGDTIAEMVVGLPPSARDGIARQNARWCVTSPGGADLVIATISGSANRIRFADLAAALRNAAKLVAADGRIALVCEAAPDLDDLAEKLRRIETPQEARRLLKNVPHAESARAWATAASRAHLYLASGYPEDLVEELYATPLKSSAELQRLVARAETVLVLPDAHKLTVT